MNQQNNLYGSAQASPRANYVPTMMDVFEFNADDLAANRNGAITEKQLARLKTLRGKWQTQIVIIVGVMVAIIAFVLLFTSRGEALRQIFSQNPTIAIAGLGGSLLLYVLILGSTMLRSRTTSNSNVGNVSGEYKTVGKLMQGLDGTLVQRVKIGKRNFYLTDIQASTFTPGVNYTVYFAGGGQMAQIISAEKV